MSLLIDIDAMRAEARRLSDLSRDPKTPVADYDNLRSTLEAVEEKITSLIIKRAGLPDCPFKCGGKMEETPTKHVLKCDGCFAIAIPGSQIRLVHVEPAIIKE